jgi:hypothetical protein
VKTTAMALTLDEWRTVRVAMSRLWKHEMAKMRRLKKTNSRQVAPQAMWMADIKELLLKLQKETTDAK